LLAICMKHHLTHCNAQHFSIPVLTKESFERTPQRKSYLFAYWVKRWNAITCREHIKILFAPALVVCVRSYLHACACSNVSLCVSLCVCACATTCTCAWKWAVAPFSSVGASSDPWTVAFRLSACWRFMALAKTSNIAAALRLSAVWLLRRAGCAPLSWASYALCTLAPLLLFVQAFSWKRIMASHSCAMVIRGGGAWCSSSAALFGALARCARRLEPRALADHEGVRFPRLGLSLAVLAGLKFGLADRRRGPGAPFRLGPRFAYRQVVPFPLRGAFARCACRLEPWAR